MADQNTPPNEDNEEKPKIFVDEDWKAQAEAEKEKIAEEVEKSKASQGTGEPGQPGAREIPPASFATLVSSTAMQAVLALGGYEDPESKKRYVDLDLAKFHIDSLQVLKEKTEGNLTDEEKKALDQAIYETRMTFVQVVQMVQQQAAGGGAGTPPPGPAAPPQAPNA